MNSFKPGDKVVFTGIGDWIPYGNKGIVLNKANADVESYIVALVGITPNNLSKKGIECVGFNLELEKDFITPIEQFIVDNE